MVAEDGTRLVVHVGDVREFAQDHLPADATGRGDVAERAQRKPHDYLPYWGLAVAEAVERRAAIDYLKKGAGARRRTYNIGIEGPLGPHAVVTPRTLTSTFMGQLVMVDGIITRCSLIRPKLVESVHYCVAKNEFHRREYRDELSPFIDSTHLPTINVFPKKDADGNPLRVEFGLSTFTDHQTLTLQEMPESAPVGQLPRSVDVRVEDDLVDAVKPGDRVRICGVYLPYTNTGQQKKGDEKTIRFHTILVANHIIQLGKKQKEPDLTGTDRANITRVPKERGPTELLSYLAGGIAPAIYGLEQEKQAVLLMLLGGEERKMEHTRVRGDMNVLLVGEPSTGKSQLLRFVLNLAPLALSTTGRGSSGVGLTAAVTTDRDTGEKTLSAGAMVLGDRGVVCIDEFDKMSDSDRVAMHEAMEQGSVTIAKAGIHASLNSRCSVLAAANPAYGFWIPHLKAANIGLPASLLSRFDLTFVVLDKGQSAEHNKEIAAHVLDTHSSAQPADQFRPGADRPADDDVRESTSKPREKFGGRTIVGVNFLRKYIQYAKANFHPVLNQESHHEAVEAYVELRERMKARDISTRITPRCLESLIRLATAHAKLRLSHTVEKVDVEVAYSLMKHTLMMTGSGPEKRAREVGDDSAAGPAPKKPHADPTAAEGASAAAEGTPVGAADGDPSAATVAEDARVLDLVSKYLHTSPQAAAFQIREAVNASEFYRDRPIPAHVFSAILRRLEAQELILFDADAVYRI